MLLTSYFSETRAYCRFFGCIIAFGLQQTSSQTISWSSFFDKKWRGWLFSSNGCRELLGYSYAVIRVIYSFFSNVWMSLSWEMCYTSLFETYLVVLLSTHRFHFFPFSVFLVSDFILHGIHMVNSHWGLLRNFHTNIGKFCYTSQFYYPLVRSWWCFGNCELSIFHWWGISDSTILWFITSKEYNLFLVFP